MENNTNFKGAKAIIVIMLLLSAFAIVSDIAIICMNDVSVRMIRNIISAAISVATVCYVIFAYKKPHGNALRHTMFVFALFIAACVPFEMGGSYWRLGGQLCVIAAAILAAFMAGRLDKIDKNRKLIILIFVLLVARVVLFFGTSTGGEIFTSSAGIGAALQAAVADHADSDTPYCLHIIRQTLPLIQWVAISLAYYVRYKQHKIAGLQDKD